VGGSDLKAGFVQASLPKIQTPSSAQRQEDLVTEDSSSSLPSQKGMRQHPSLHFVASHQKVTNVNALAAEKKRGRHSNVLGHKDQSSGFPMPHMIISSP